MQRKILLAAAAAVATGTFSIRPAQAATTWNVAGDGLWTNAANWSPATAPPNTAPFVDVAFNTPGLNADEKIYLNTVARNVLSLSVTNTGTTTFRGGTDTTPSTSGRIVLNDPAGISVASGAGAVTFGETGANAAIQVNSSLTIQNNSAAALTFATVINSIAGDRTVTFDGAGPIVASGEIQEGANGGILSIVKNGAGTMSLVANSFDGNVTVNAGTINLGSSSAFGPSAVAKTLTINGGTLAAITSARTIPAPVSVVVGGNFTLGGQGQATNLAGTVDLGGATRTITVNNSGGGNGSSLTGVVSNGGITKSGASTLSLTGDNTFTGPVAVGNGVLRLAATTGQALGGATSIAVNTNDNRRLLLGASNQINNAATLALNGGVFDTGGFNEGSVGGAGEGVAGVGALTVSASSIIDLGAGSSILAFANSSGATWTGTNLDVHNWSGLAGVGGGTDRLFFGSDSAGLTADQLLKVRFFSDAGITQIVQDTSILPTGEVVPVPEPTGLAVLALGAGALFVRRRRA